MKDPKEKEPPNPTQLDEVAAPVAFQIPGLEAPRSGVSRLDFPPEDAVSATVPLPTESAGLQEPSVELPVLSSGARYDGMEEFARGGLGRILRATDKRLGRPVAIKELLRNRGSAELRFIREAYLTARLEHPSIVPVHDSGRWQSGAPFFTMKLIAGRTLKEALDDTRGLSERLALLPHLIDTCEAMAYAHSKRIIHRDLKPHNILVGEFGETVVIDWGIAKELGESAPDEPEPETEQPSEVSKETHDSLTKVGAVMGTPAFMPPEQASGDPVDERADVYALGAILYYFLTGTPPYTGVSGRDIVNQVLLGAPPPVLSVQPEAPKDLAAITTKAMARDLTVRYRNAKELAKDLRDYQLGGLVGVYKYSLSELISRWLKRNKLTVTVASALLVFIVVGGVLSIRSIIKARTIAESARDDEARQRQKAEEQGELARQRQQQAEEHSNQLHLLQARNNLDTDPAATLAWLKDMSPNATGWSYARLLAQETIRRGAARYVFRGHRALVNNMMFSPNGKLLASASKDGTVRLWDLEAKTDTTLYVSPKDILNPPEVTSAAFSPDGLFIAAADTSGVVCLWALSEIAAGKLAGKPLEGHSAAVNALAFSPDGKWLATASDDTLLLLWEVSTGTRKPMGTQMSPVKSIAFAPNGKVLASAGQDGSVFLWSLETNTPTRLQGTIKPEVPLRFLANEDKLLGAAEGGLLLWPLREPESAPFTLSIEGLSPRGIEVSADGKWLAVAGVGGQVHRWSFVEKQWLILKGGVAAIGAMRFSPSGDTLAAASDDRLVWLWDTRTGTAHSLKGHLGGVHTLTFSPDGETLASVCDYNAVRLWNLSDGAELGTSLLFGHNALVTDITAAKDAQTLFSVDEAGGVWAWDTREETGALLTRSSTALLTVAVSPDQKTLAFAGKDAVIRLLDIESGKIDDLKGHSDAVKALAFAPDGKTLASGSEDATLLFWDLSTKTSKKIGWFQGGVNALAFSPDGALLGIGTADRATQVLQIESAQLTQVSVHLDGVSAVAFSADGKWFASGSLDKAIRVFEVASLLQPDAKPRFSLDGHGGRVTRLSFSADGSQLLSTSSDRSTRLWDLESAQHVIVQASATEGLAALYLTESNRLVSSTDQHALIVWQNDEIPTEPAALKAWLSSATTARVGTDYKLRSNQ